MRFHVRKHRKSFLVYLRKMCLIFPCEMVFFFVMKKTSYLQSFINLMRVVKCCDLAVKSHFVSNYQSV